MRGEQAFKKLISTDTGGRLGDALRWGLQGLSKIYEQGVTYRNQKYDASDSIYRPNIPVISIGNITVGGTGKTPMVRYVCRLLQEAHKKPTILSRGYKADNNKESIVVSRSGQVRVSSFVSGDEAWLLAKTLPQCSVIIGAKRAESARIAEHELESDVLVLDDGFQHRALGRDFDIILIDATNPFGYEYVLPRGLLREPLKNLNRADYIVITKVNQALPSELEMIDKRLENLVPHIPVAKTTHRSVGVQTIDSWAKGDALAPLDTYQREQLLAVSGIGQPLSFLHSLEDLGYTIKETMWFSDHHDYTEQDVVKMWKRCFTRSLTGIITTEKDAVKLLQLQAVHDLQIPIYVLVIGIEFIEGEDHFKEALLQVSLSQ